MIKIAKLVPRVTWYVKQCRIKLKSMTGWNKCMKAAFVAAVIYKLLTIQISVGFCCVTYLMSGTVLIHFYERIRLEQSFLSEYKQEKGISFWFSLLELALDVTLLQFYCKKKMLVQLFSCLKIVIFRFQWTSLKFDPGVDDAQLLALALKVPQLELCCLHDTCLGFASSMVLVCMVTSLGEEAM